jgi:hypothetical protein
VEDSVCPQCEACETVERDLPRDFCHFVVGKLLAVLEESMELRKDTEYRLSILFSDQAELVTVVRDLSSELRGSVRELKGSPGALLWLKNTEFLCPSRRLLGQIIL